MNVLLSRGSAWGVGRCPGRGRRWRFCRWGCRLCPNWRRNPLPMVMHIVWWLGPNGCSRRRWHWALFSQFDLGVLLQVADETVPDLFLKLESENPLRLLERRHFGV